jgi:mRNA degradation ribonuclease J1/J2
MPNPREELVFAPLGGVGEIGMNLALYGIGSERNRRWIVVDFGVAFAGDDLPGIDLIMPDIAYLIEERRNVLGIVLTHAHEDHFGALLDLWPRLRVPVYATPFSAALLESKRLSEPLAPEIDVRAVPLGGRINLGPFEVEFVSVAHSIPESNALIRVAVTTFASHVARLRAVAAAARAADREVVVVGRAMDRVVQVARETGYLDGVQDFLSAESYGYLPPDKVVALCTGSQGEPRAALSRIARDEHPEVTLGKGDRVIFSARPIPGNEKAISGVINGLVRQGVEVITDRTHLVHVSGHPRRDEMADMYRWVRPQIALPVHGEALHLAEHAKLARAAGVKDVILCANGDLVRLAPGPTGVIDEVRAGRLYKDGRLIVDAEQRTVADRRRLGFAGIVTVAIALDQKGVMVANPEVSLIGIPLQNAEGDSFARIVDDVVIDTVEQLPKARRRDPESVVEAVRGAVRSAIAENWGKKPLCLVHVLTV